MNDLKIEDKVLDKIKKVYALVEQGYEGEAKAAKFQLDKLLKKYNITLEEILEEESEEEYEFKHRTKYEKQLIYQIIAKVCGRKKQTFYFQKGRKVVLVKLTKAEYIDVNEHYQVYIDQWFHELNDFKQNLCDAFIQKHKLVPAPSDDDIDSEPMDWKKMQKMLSLMNALDDVTITKKLEQ